MSSSEEYNYITPTFNGGNNNVAIKQKKKIILPLIIGGILLLAITIIAIIFLTKKKDETDLIVLVAPEIATIEIDGKNYKNGNYKITPGIHTVSISADGFSYYDAEFEVDKENPYYLSEYLTPETSQYTEKDYEILSIIAEDQATINMINERERAKTIYNILPISFEEYGVVVTDYSDDKTCEKPALCLQITNSGNLNEDSAKNLLRTYNYDPNDYEIIYNKEEMTNEN